MPDKKALTILLIEDDEGHAELVKTNLRRGGITNSIIHFPNGKDVVDFLFNKKEIRKHRFHPSENYLMMLDLNMPVMDGYEVLRMLKSHETTKTMPIIVLTTTSDKKEVERCYELGCNVYVTKPVEYEHFSSAIRELGLFLAVVKVPERKVIVTQN